MNTYNGKIYQIVCSHCNMLYIGSTKESLSKRFYRHKKASRAKKTEHLKLYQHMREVGMDKFKIVLVEELPNTTLERLRMAEHRNIILNDSVKKGLNGVYAHGTKCVHDKQRSCCKECGGSQICEHKRVKGQCKECGGSQICEHKRFKPTCKECGGSQICEHKRFKSTCKECGGSQICEHNKRKDQCKECGGSQICEHNKRKDQCKECNPQHRCDICGTNYAGKSGLIRHYRSKKHILLAGK